MPAPWPAALAYFALVFALGFVLGTVRTLLVHDEGERVLGVLIELPLMLLASWWICRALLRRLDVPGRTGPRALMGGAAFALLIGAEMLLGAVFSGRSVVEHLALYREASHALGLAGQIGFGLIPLLQLRLDRGRR